ncbi:MAG: helix-turn-helix transcriptional regulator [Candidatus Hydrogenedentes bacterium]|nr:helix-turn-helix transcriptional regulator [Candidatus Hydrogenedentota bacterium]
MEINNALAALQSLSHKTRLLIFRLLVRQGPEGMMAGDIATQLGVPAPTLSFHLNHLGHAGLIERRRDGRTQWYTVRFEQVRELLGYLVEDCCQGRPELCGMAADPCCAPNPAEHNDECHV